MSNGEKDWKKFKEEHDVFDDAELGQDDDLASASVESALEAPSIESLETKLDAAEKLAHENWEKSVRAMAELENVKRRAEREVANAHKYGSEKLISSLLPVLDSLEQALQLTEKSGDEPMKEGLELTMKLFLDALHKFDVEQLHPEGEPFNPQEHEAMSMIDVPGAAPNSVVNVFQKGYKLSDRVIRPARVIVSKNN